jgi:hypothetical protein
MSEDKIYENIQYTFIAKASRIQILLSSRNSRPGIIFIDIYTTAAQIGYDRIL